MKLSENIKLQLKLQDKIRDYVKEECEDVNNEMAYKPETIRALVSAEYEQGIKYTLDTVTPDVAIKFAIWRSGVLPEEGKNILRKMYAIKGDWNYDEVNTTLHKELFDLFVEKYYLRT